MRTQIEQADNFGGASARDGINWHFVPRPCKSRWTARHFDRSIEAVQNGLGKQKCHPNMLAHDWPLGQQPWPSLQQWAPAGQQPGWSQHDEPGGQQWLRQFRLAPQSIGGGKLHPQLLPQSRRQLVLAAPVSPAQTLSKQLPRQVKLHNCGRRTPPFESKPTVI
jgi:hypothetical protein